MKKTGCMMQLFREKQSKELKNRKRWLGKCPLRTQLVFTVMGRVESAVKSEAVGEGDAKATCGRFDSCLAD
jgi:hypothetical protein